MYVNRYTKRCAAISKQLDTYAAWIQQLRRNLLQQAKGLMHSIEQEIGKPHDYPDHEVNWTDDVFSWFELPNPDTTSDFDALTDAQADALYDAYEECVEKSEECIMDLNEIWDIYKLLQLRFEDLN